MCTWLLLRHVMYSLTRMLCYMNSQVPNTIRRRITVSTEVIPDWVLPRDYSLSNHNKIMTCHTRSCLIDTGILYYVLNNLY